MNAVASRRFAIPLVLAVTICVASSLAYGWLDGRWVDRPNVDAVAAQLQKIPVQFGDWSLVKKQELPESTLRMLQCYGYSLQVYQNARTGGRVNVAVLFGPRGPIAVHTPEVCYSGVGLTPSGPSTREVVNIDGNENTLWRVNLRSERDSKPKLEAYYAWSEGGIWQAAEYPRFWLTGKLYKIQLACEATQPGQTPVALQFLDQFLPVLQPLLDNAAHR